MLPARLRVTAMVAATGVLLALVACGEDDERPAPAGLAPADVAVYVEAAVSGQGGDARRLDAYLARLLPGGRALPAVADIAGLVLDAKELDAREFEPWLGERAALLISEQKPEELAMGLLFEVRDRDRAERFVRRLAGRHGRRAGHRGVGIWKTPGGQGLALVDGFVAVASTPDEVQRMVDASRGRSLADAPAYARALESLPDDAVARAYVHTGRLADALGRAHLPEAADLVGLPRPGRETVVTSLAIEGRAAVLEVRTEEPPRWPSPSIAGLPGDAWFARSSGDLGTELVEGVPVLGPGRRRGLRRFMRDAGLDLEEDLAPWMGPATLFLQGGVREELSGELLVDVEDQQPAADAVARIGREIRDRGDMRVTEVDHDRDGTASVTMDLGAGWIARMDVQDGELRAEVGGPGSSRDLGEMPRVREAARLLGRPPDFWLDVAPVADILSQLGFIDGVTLELLGPLSYVASRTVRDGDGSLARYAFVLDPGAERRRGPPPGGSPVVLRQP